MPKKKLRSYSLEEMEDKHIGKKGTPAQTNQASKDLNLKWIEACQFAKRIEKALMDNEIIIDNKKREILSADGNGEMIL